MPLKCKSGRKPRFRVKTEKSGKKTRLAFCGNKVVEAVPLSKRGTKPRKRHSGFRKTDA